jgi:hypothetical protein
MKMFSLRMLPDILDTQRCNNGLAAAFKRPLALAAVVLGVWTLWTGPSMAAPPCALVCPFDTVLDAKKCRCVNASNATPILPCGLVCVAPWRLDAQQCRCVKK